MLEDGSLDGGMGFESLIGARLQIKKFEYVIINKRTFENVTHSEVFIGKLTRKEKQFLNSIY